MFPDTLELLRTGNLPKEIRALDGTLVFLPDEPLTESPLVKFRKKWRLFPNYTVVKEVDNEYVDVKVNTTGQIVRLNYDPDVWDMLGFIRRERPGATVEEVIAEELKVTVEQAGEFKDEDLFATYVIMLYLDIAYLLHYGILVLAR